MKRAMLGDPPFKARKVGVMPPSPWVESRWPTRVLRDFNMCFWTWGGRMQQTRLASDSLLRTLNGWDRLARFWKADQNKWRLWYQLTCLGFGGTDKMRGLPWTWCGPWTRAREKCQLRTSYFRGCKKVNDQLSQRNIHPGKRSLWGEWGFNNP